MSRAKGDIAEQKAVIFLSENGFKIIEQNFYSRFGEIDIIALKNDTLHFIEVKSGADYELAVQNITPAKIRKIIRTSDVYIKKHRYQNDFQYDGVIVTPDTISYIDNITL